MTLSEIKERVKGHTPGKWKFDSVESVVLDQYEANIAEVSYFPQRDYWEANAALIEAAPDLLALAEELETELIATRLERETARAEASTVRLLGEAQHARAEAAESEVSRLRAELSEIRHELVQCDDIKLDQPLVGIIASLQRDRDWLRAELGKRESK